MDIKISAQKFDLTESLKSYINKKFEKLKRFADFFSSAEIHAEVIKNEKVVRLLLKSKHDENLFCEAKDKDSMYKALDIVFDKIEKQLVKLKEHHLKQKH